MDMIVIAKGSNMNRGKFLVIFEQRPLFARENQRCSS